jgi:hypothetical protein
MTAMLQRSVFPLFLSRHLLVLCLLCAPVAAAELGVLAPLIVDGQPLMKRDAKNREVPVVTRDGLFRILTTLSRAPEWVSLPNKGSLR